MLSGGSLHKDRQVDSFFMLICSIYDTYLNLFTNTYIYIYNVFSNWKITNDGLEKHKLYIYNCATFIM